MTTYFAAKTFDAQSMGVAIRKEREIAALRNICLLFLLASICAAIAIVIKLGDNIERFKKNS